MQTNTTVHVDPREVEIPDGTPVAQVVALWNRTVFDVRHVGQGKGDEAASQTYTVGEGEDAHFPLSGDGLPDPAGFPLVQRDARGITVRTTAAMHGLVRQGGTTWQPLRQFTDAQGCVSLPLGAEARITIGDATFHICAVPPGRHVDSRTPADRPFWVSNGLSAVGLGTLLALSQLVPSEASALTLDDVLSDARYVGYHDVPDEQEEEEAIDTDDARDEDAGGQGQRHAGSEGKMGNPKEKATSGVYAMKGPRDALPTMARQFDPELAAREVGILGVMQSMPGHFLASPTAMNAFAVGNDDEDVWGGFTGDQIAASHGVGGLGLVGTGRGGGGNASGVLGLGNVGTIGKGAGGGTGNSYGTGNGSGTKFSGRAGRKPRVRIAGPTKSQGVDKDIIRRVVRGHINEVRYCYNQGLVRDPNLAGRVVIQFTIGPTGTVSLAVVQNSTLSGDKSTGRCIAKAVKRWRFPKPSHGGGTAVVSYPFVLNPG